MPHETAKSFFVGYAPLPARLGRSVLTVAVVVVLCSIVLGALLAGAQRDPGDGQWADDESTVTGSYSSAPYPMIRAGRSPGVLLVCEGKFGLTRSDRALESQTVRATGRPITRGSLRLLELAGPLERVGAANSTETFETAPAVDRTFVGEIVDPKCFAGAMKPGDGKTHKSCAALCLRGGIPPVLHSGDAFYVLTGPNLTRCGGATLERVIALVGERVVVHGKLRTLPGLPVLEISSDSIDRP